MTTIYQEQPRAEDNGAVGLVAGLVLVLAVIALVFLATRATPATVTLPSATPNGGAGVQIDGNGSGNSATPPSNTGGGTGATGGTGY